MSISKLHIVSVCNENFAVGLLALLRSTLHFNPGCRFSVVQATPAAFSSASRRRFLDEGADIIEVASHRIVEAITKLRARNDYYDVETYTKFLLPDYLSEPFWWVDSDVIALQPFRPAGDPTPGLLMKVAPSRLPVVGQFAGLEDPATREHFEKFARFDQVTRENVSLNGGIIWINPRTWRDTDFTDRALEVLSQLGPHLRAADESIINLLRCDYPIGVLPDTIQRFAGEPADFKSPFLHYAGRTKPWMSEYPDDQDADLHRRWLRLRPAAAE
jgi:lipopolysaccharide biosynthesis glycosyltransferase